MKIHLFDLDPRFYSDSNYKETMGSFGTVAHGFNMGLKSIGAYAEPNEADWVGICDGLNLGIEYKNKKTFVINVWDCINSLPDGLVQIQKQSNQKMLGLSSQVSKLWQKYGIDCKTAMPGCDTNFWKQTKEKNEKITFLFNSFGNVRSGLDLALSAFHIAFAGNKNVKLIIKNTGSSTLLKSLIAELSKECDVDFIDERITASQMRDLYSVSHVSLNVMRHSSWGLNVHEAAACGCIPILGNFCPSNEMVTGDYALFLDPNGEVEIPTIAPKIAQDFGLHNAYGNLKYSEAPRIYSYNVHDYARILKNVSTMTKETFKLIDTRTPIVQNWSWEKAAQNLVKALQ